MLTIYNKNVSFVQDNESMFFGSLGYGVLTDLTSDALITEELNGSYILEFEYLQDGKLSEYLIEENIIKANGEPFSIYSIKKSTNKKIKILAKHWVLNEWDKDFIIDSIPTNLNAQQALAWVQTRSINKSNISISGNCSGYHTARYVRKKMLDVVFNDDNSILKKFGGELTYHQNSVEINNRRGSVTGLTIRQGKNLSGAEYYLDFSTVATRLIPVGNDGLLLNSTYVDSPLINNYATPIIKKVEVDTDNTADLISYCNKLYNNGIDKPTVSIKIDFIELSKTIEYKNYSSLESVHLGDSVNVYIPSLNINITTRVVKTTYNENLKRITQLELGSVMPNIVVSNKLVSDITENYVTNVRLEATRNSIEAEATSRFSISKSVTGKPSITLENAYKGQLYYLSIKGQISLLFPQSSFQYGYPLVPSNDLTPSDILVPSSPVPYGNEVHYPSNTLFSKSSILLIDNKEYKLDFDFLNYLNDTVYDEFIYNNGICYIIRRVGLDSQGEMYALDKEVIEPRKGITLEVDQSSTISLKSFNNATLSATYLVDNIYTKNFANEVKTSALFQILSNSITEIVRSKVGNDEIIAMLNLAIQNGLGIVRLVGNQVIIDSDHFKLDAGGNAEMSSATLTNGILKIGTKEIFNTSGVLSSLIINGVVSSPSFIFNGDFCPMGDLWDGSNIYTKEHMSFSFNLPSNFTVLGAYITITHEPCDNVDYYGTSHTGYCRNLGLFKGTISNSSKKYVSYIGGYLGNENTTYNQIYNAWETSGNYFNGSNNSVTSETTIDIKNYISSGLNHFVIMSDGGSTSEDTAYYEKAGAVLGQMIILGYTKI